MKRVVGVFFVLQGFYVWWINSALHHVEVQVLSYDLHACYIKDILNIYFNSGHQIRNPRGMS